MDNGQSAAERALVRLLTPSQGTRTCGVPAERTEALHGAPCYWRGSSAESAARHRNAEDLADERERLGSAAPRGRALGKGHRYVPADAAADAAEVAGYAGTVRARRLIAAEESSK
jgi:hypothetical protein